ncbi:MAG TPA: hypothetical protein PK580_00220 [Nitrosomonas halophila]|nr:hypothetical protein [Nitrosomonas halophila]
MIDQRTAHHDLPLPHPSNELSEDVGRLRELVTLLDALLNALNTDKSSVDHGHDVGDVEGLASILTALVPKVTEVQAGNGLVGGGALADHINMALGIPGTLNAESENAVSGESHTHKVMFPVLASQAEMETGTEQEIRSMSPLRVAQAIAAKALPNLVINSQSINYTAVKDDQGRLIDLSSASNRTLSFQAAATLGNGWWCYVRNNGTGNVTLDPSGSETVDGDLTKILSPSQARLIVCTGSAFISILVDTRINMPVNDRVFTTSGTFIAPVTGFYVVRVVGAGGSGAAMRGHGPNGVTGGAAGGYAVKTFFARQGDTFTVTVGAGGASRDPASSGQKINGANGGSSSFVGNGINVVANGGAGGRWIDSPGTQNGATGGSSSGGDANFTGGGSGSITFAAGASTALIAATGGGAVNVGFVTPFSSGSISADGSNKQFATGGAGTGGSSASITFESGSVATPGGGAGGTGTLSGAGPGIPANILLNGPGGVGTASPAGGGGGGGAVYIYHTGSTRDGGLFGGSGGFVHTSTNSNGFAGSSGLGAGGGGGTAQGDYRVRSGAGGDGIVFINW